MITFKITLWKHIDAVFLQLVKLLLAPLLSHFWKFRRYAFVVSLIVEEVGIVAFAHDIHAFDEFNLAEIEGGVCFLVLRHRLERGKLFKSQGVGAGSYKYGAWFFVFERVKCGSKVALFLQFLLCLFDEALLGRCQHKDEDEDS